ncbi:MAG: peptide deformylase [Methylovulum sp.]|nr:peptide deformylase [Methylovulum sp.]
MLLTDTRCAQLGAKILRQHAMAVDDVHATDIRQTIDIMQQIMMDTHGVGIAAPQVNVSKRIIIVASRPTKRYPYAPLMAPTVMINPSFQVLSDTKEKGWEGCLSIPAIRALVPRYQAITTQYTDLQGILRTLNLDGFVARIFQHECDHLDGKLFLDRVEDNGDIISESEYYKLTAKLSAG